MPVSFADAHGKPLEQIFDIPGRTKSFSAPSWHLGQPVDVLLESKFHESSFVQSLSRQNTTLSSGFSKFPRLRSNVKVEATIALVLNISGELFWDSSLVAVSRSSKSLNIEAALQLERRWKQYVDTVLEDPSTLPRDAVPKGMSAAGLSISLGATGCSALVSKSTNCPNAVAFGENYDGELGLGAGSFSGHYSCAGKWHGSPKPCLEVIDELILDMSLMNRHALFLTSRGRVYMSGLKYSSPREIIESPQEMVRGIASTRICMVSAGFDHSILLAHDGRVFTFGETGISRDREGQLGRGANLDHREYPQEVPTLSPQAIEACIVGVAAGMHTTFAYDDLGRLWAWGRNGTLPADNSVTGHGHGEQLKKRSQYTTKPKQVAVLIEAGARIVRVSAGMHHVLALDSNGQIWAWGRNLNGELGLGNKQPQHIPKAISAIGSSSLETLPPCVSIAAGHLSSSAVGVDGTVWMWGDAGRCVGLQAPVYLRLRRTPRGLGRHLAVWPHPRKIVKHLEAPVEARYFRNEGIIRVVAGSLGTVFINRAGACFVVSPSFKCGQFQGPLTHNSSEFNLQNPRFSELEKKSEANLVKSAWVWRLNI
jgi:alpha-tubulin suppressor-like RCC1 family protein